MDTPVNVEPYAQRAVPLSELINKVRRFMRDRGVLNRLIAGEESSDEDIMLAIDLCISDFNHTPPPVGKFDFLTPPPLYLLMYGTVVKLLESKGLLESRNSLPFNDGGLSVAADKDQRTQAWLAHFSNKFETDKLKWKVMKNIEDSWGVSLSSEYIIVNNIGWISMIY
jgi:hypothetical protein